MQRHKEPAQGDLLHSKPSNKNTNTQTKIQLQDKDLELSNVDHVSANAKSSQQAAMLYIFKENEAVIKVIIEDRSPTMRHVSRTYRVALDWSIDRINWDPKIQIKYMDTNHQLEDILTKGNFTRDEWNNLLRLFNISDHSSNNELLKMAKRVQDGTGEERAIAKSRPTMNLVSQTLARSSMAQRSDASNRPGTHSASSEDLGLISSRNLLQGTRIRTTQHRVLKCGKRKQNDKRRDN